MEGRAEVPRRQSLGPVRAHDRMRRSDVADRTNERSWREVVAADIYQVQDRLVGGEEPSVLLQVEEHERVEARGTVGGDDLDRASRAEPFLRNWDGRRPPELVRLQSRKSDGGGQHGRAMDEPRVDAGRF